MLAKTGLLILSNPSQINKILSGIQKQVKSTLYIQLLSALGDPLGSFHPKTFTSWPKFSRTIFNIYAQAAVHCNNLDVRVLLSGLKYNIPKIRTQKQIDLVIFDKSHSENDVQEFIQAKIENITKEYNVMTLDLDNTDFITESMADEPVFNYSVLGGTFDRLHVAHKLLLSESVLRSKQKVLIGITEENMLHTKLLWELIEDIDIRMKNVTDFLNDICPELQFNLVPISDPFGPSITDPSMEMMIVSEETIKGGRKTNEIRKENNLPLLELVSVPLIDEPNPSPIEEKKISSSTTRIRLLGTVLRPIQPNTNIPKSPYIIGLTGGIASGKSGVVSHLQNLGAFIINCDIIAHNVYKSGKPSFDDLVQTFGKKIVNENGEIDRKILGAIVFKDNGEMNKLNLIVWPRIADEIQRIIKNCNNKVVVIEAAVLLMAGWEKYCHEIWTTIIPRAEAINRLVNRNQLTEEQAINRIDSQPKNIFYVKNSHVVFYPYWDVKYTRDQVVRAWELLQQRINC